MKIVTWNCNGALRKKFDALEEFDADIFVVQECEDPAQFTKKYAEWAGEYLWSGESKSKGLGVFAKKGISLEKLDWPNAGYRQFLAVRVNDECNLLAVWTLNSPTDKYIGQFRKYLQLNKDRISAADTVICGDLNSNAVWDEKYTWSSHLEAVGELRSIGLHSMYHELHDEEHGQEVLPTFYMHRKKERPYHIDYVFVPKRLMVAGRLEVGSPDRWLSKSDHMPLVVAMENLVDGAMLDRLRKRVWDVFKRPDNEFAFDDNETASDYTWDAIMELWERPFPADLDRRKAVLLLAMIMRHDRMNHEAGNFEYLADHKELVEKILEKLC